VSTTKRVFDVAAAALGLALLSPALAIVAVLIKREDGGPVLHPASRVGKGGKLFQLWKFRTMVPRADQLGGPLTVWGDPRITRIGATLRRYKLDELPQLVNVICGEMSLVGPRPEAPELVMTYTSQQREVLCLTPGITDPASIEYANENEILASVADPEAFYVSQVMPEKIRINLLYSRRANLFTDVGVILRTLGRIARG